MTRLLTLLVAVLAMSAAQAQDDFPFDVTEITSFDEPWAIAVLPDDKPKTLALFAEHAHAHVTGSKVSWRYDRATSRALASFEIATESYDGSGNAGVTLSVPNVTSALYSPLPS